MYTLNDDNIPEPCFDMQVWAKKHEERRHVQDHLIATGVEHIRVSTVFLGIDHSPTPFFLLPDPIAEADRKPLLFETTVFGGEYNGLQLRCCTYDEALAQHDIVLQKVKYAAKDN